MNDISTNQPATSQYYLECRSCGEHDRHSVQFQMKLESFLPPSERAHVILLRSATGQWDRNSLLAASSIFFLLLTLNYRRGNWRPPLRHADSPTRQTAALRSSSSWPPSPAGVCGRVVVDGAPCPIGPGNPDSNRHRLHLCGPHTIGEIHSFPPGRIQINGQR